MTAAVWGVLESALADGRLILWILGVVLLEAIVWALYWRRTGRGPPPREWLATLLAGAFLMLALRAALRDESATTVCAWLLAAGLAHGVEVIARLRARRDR